LGFSFRVVGLGDAAYFAVSTPGTGAERSKTDGTDTDTVLAKDIEPGPDHSLRSAKLG
jgi:ELWxxDGT repeat protein